MQGLNQCGIAQPWESTHIPGLLPPHTNPLAAMHDRDIRDTASIDIYQSACTLEFMDYMTRMQSLTGCRKQRWEAMWTDVQRQRFNHLRDREWRGTLTPEEQRKLAAMMQEICDMEATYLQPATDRLQHETAQLRAELEQVLRRNRQLDTLTQRKEALLTHALRGAVKVFLRFFKMPLPDFGAARSHGE